ncbi:hypothetical protein, conserved [Eimeria tenella]|uniref:Uncharacterized protein n=1 Tax=Eimeria tenella TaxID=5802 RepID=U6KMW4_EIMTE|nr:hypothetical protein, conserved [Eimeria tenella]CDJ37627.1 hypothetical protein, conserved [Eimeria tenella]|eukprot:XP_013228465.1 hypothetical protein, conserved [Eimeria tenella]
MGGLGLLPLLLLWGTTAAAAAAAARATYTETNVYDMLGPSWVSKAEAPLLVGPPSAAASYVGPYSFYTESGEAPGGPLTSTALDPASSNASSAAAAAASAAPKRQLNRTLLLQICVLVAFGSLMFLVGANSGRRGLREGLLKGGAPAGAPGGPWGAPGAPEGTGAPGAPQGALGAPELAGTPKEDPQTLQALAVAEQYDQTSLCKLITAAEQLLLFLQPVGLEAEAAQLLRQAQATEADLQLLLETSPEQQQQQQQQVAAAARRLLKDNSAEMGELAAAVEASVRKVTAEKCMQVFGYEKFLRESYEAALVAHGNEGLGFGSLQQHLLSCSAAATQQSLLLQQERAALQQRRQQVPKSLSEAAAALNTAAAAAARVQLAAARAAELLESGMQGLDLLTSKYLEEVRQLKGQLECMRKRVQQAAAATAAAAAAAGAAAPAAQPGDASAAAAHGAEHPPQQQQQRQQQQQQRGQRRRQSLLHARLEAAAEKLELLRDLILAVKNPYSPSPMRETLKEVHETRGALQREVHELNETLDSFIELQDSSDV